MSVNAVKYLHMHDIVLFSVCAVTIIISPQCKYDISVKTASSAEW